MLEAFKASVDRDTAQEQRQLRAAAKAAGRSGGGEAVRQPSGGPMVADPGAPDISDNPQAPGTAGAPAGSVSQQGTLPLTREPSTTPVRPAQSQAYADLAPGRLAGPSGVQLPFGLPLLLLLQVVALGLAYFAGTLQDGSASDGRPEVMADSSGPGSGGVKLLPVVQASGAATTSTPAVGPARPDPQQSGAPSQLAATRAADAAFEDPANRFTIVVFTADNYEVGKERTWAMFDHLAAAGLDPVTPRAVDGRIYLLVGAESSPGALEDLKGQIRQMTDPDGKTRPFNDAYVNNIDQYLP